MTTSTEVTDLLSALEKHRSFLRQTIAGVSDTDAGRRTTVSELCLGGIIKHVTSVETRWVDFIERGPEVMQFSPASMENHAASFRMLPEDTVAELLAAYEEAARRTEKVITDLPSLDAGHPLPAAPWFEPGASWSARRVAVHIIAETAQHAGHADIIREAIDGAKTMG